MSLTIITRAQWGARPPREVQNVSTVKRTGFMVHHSGAPAGQSVKVIQDYHMDTRGWSDIGYNFLVRDTGAIYEGRGWNHVGAHCTGWNTATIGVCLIGDYNHVEPPHIALESIGALYDEAQRHCGKTLRLMGHRDSGASTDGPGDLLEKWVRMGLPGAGGVVSPGDHQPGSRELFVTAPQMSGGDVAFVQRFIGASKCGPADGQYGPHTESGVRWYQSMRGIGVDGRVGKITWGQMGVTVRFG